MKKFSKNVLLLIVLVFFPLPGFTNSKKADELLNKKSNLFILENNKALFHPEDTQKIRIAGHLGSILVARKKPEIVKSNSNGINDEFINVVVNDTGLEVLVNINDIRAIDLDKPKKIAYINADIELTHNGKKLRFGMGERFNYEEIDGKINLLLKIHQGLDTETGTYKNGEEVRLPIAEDEKHFLEDKRIILIDDSNVYDKKRTFSFDDNIVKNYECGSSVSTISENNFKASAGINLPIVEAKADAENKTQTSQSFGTVNKIVSKSTVVIYQDKTVIEKFLIEKEKDCESNRTQKLTVYSTKNKTKVYVFSIDFRTIFGVLGIKSEGDYLLNTESNWLFFDYIKKHNKLLNKDFNGEASTILLYLLMYYNMGSFSKYEMNSINIERLK